MAVLCKISLIRFQKNRTHWRPDNRLLLETFETFMLQTTVKRKNKIYRDKMHPPSPNGRMVHESSSASSCARSTIRISGRPNLSQRCKRFATASTFTQVAVLLWRYVVEIDCANSFVNQISGFENMEFNFSRIEIHILHKI